MIVTMIGKNSLNKLVLPHKPMGNYWLYDKTTEDERKLVNIEAIDGKWQLVSNSHSVIINQKNIEICGNKIKILNREKNISRMILKEYGFYWIKVKEEDLPYLLYYAPIYEPHYLHLRMKKEFEILIGRDKKKNHILINNALLSPIHAKLYRQNGKWMVQNFNKMYHTYVNDKLVSEQTMTLQNGDVVFILGIKIMVMGSEIFISNPSQKVKYNSNYFTLIKTSPAILKKQDEEMVLEGDESNYFSRPPRMLKALKEKNIKIERLQKETKEKGLPIILLMGTMLSFAVMTLVSIIQTLDSFIQGQVNKKNTLFTLIMSGVMLLSSLLFPLLTQQYTTNQEKKSKAEQKRRYKNYLEDKLKIIEEELVESRNILSEVYPSNQECFRIIGKKDVRLWERKESDRDFLMVRLGIGDIPSNLEIDIPPKEESFEEQSGEFEELVEQCVEQAKVIKDAPVLLSFAHKKVVAMITNHDKDKFKLIQNILLQLVTFHSYDELKLVFLLKNNGSRDWDFAKMLPHTWNGIKNFRFFAYDYTKMKEISQFLNTELNKRKAQEEGQESENKSGIPHYLIIIEDYKMVENLTIINEILKSENNMGFSLFIITNHMNYLPNECETFITLDSGKGILLDSQNSTENEIAFRLEENGNLPFDDISRVLFNIPIKYTEEKEMLLPSSYNFLEMFKVGCIEQLNILDRWKKNDSTISLAAPLGVDGYGSLIELDIHEKFHGPHGLIAGSTGSGKSEFIITYILSLAINYHPDDVTFVLIDYKGGGLTGAFQKPDIQLPHLVGTITNIDKSGLQRSLESIESELKRRQIEFNEAKITTNESTMDIYKYQKYYHQGALEKPISHLFIISDEFAELKEQEPEFIDQLVSIARIGRSLGIHLILATQKPSGVVNDQIRSNSKFGICLKVQSPSDSQDIIGIGDGAKLKGAGQFYLKVGNDDYLALGQAAWAGAKYYPSNEVKKEYDNSVEFISSTGMILKKVDDEVKRSEECKGEQITNIVNYLCELAEKENIKEQQLWLENIPETIYLTDTREKYHVENERNVIKAVIGEYDNPSKQIQNVEILDFSNNGNVIVYGNAKSGKETLIGTLIYDFITNYTPDELNLYILDFGSEAMKVFKKAPQVGDIIFASEEEKLIRFFGMLQDEIIERKEILSDYNGDYKLYLNKTEGTMPTFVIILNNYETYLENYEMKFDELFEILIREGEKCGIYFLLTVSSASSIRYRMGQNFRQKIALQMNTDDELSNIFDRIGKKRASKLFGRGIINIEEDYFEFQTAKICEPNVWNEVIMKQIEELNKTYKNRARAIPTIPEVVSMEHVKNAITTMAKVPIGITQKNLRISTYNLNTNLITMIATRDQTEDIIDFIASFIEVFFTMPETNLEVFDADHIFDVEENLKEKQNALYEFLNQSEGEINDTVCLIIGLRNFIEILEDEDINDEDEDRDVFLEYLENAENSQKCKVIVIDNDSNLEEYEDSDWFDKYITKNYGIWIGNGAESQRLIEVTDESHDFTDDCGPTYGYVIKKGKPTLIKVLGMEEKDEEEDE